MKIDKITIGTIAVILLFFFILFSFTGLRLIIGIALLYILPFYLILDNFSLEKEEKLIFSFFIGIGIFPAMVYYLGILLNLNIAIIITFILLTALGLLLKKLKK